MYQGSAGVGLIETTPINILPVDYAADDPALRKKVYAAPQDYRPFPHFGTINLRSNLGHSTYHSGTVKLEKRYSKGINFLTFYTFSKNLDSGASVAPLQNRSLGKGRTDYDRNHRFVASVTYELPFGRGKKWLNRGGIWNLLFGGYQVVCIQTLESGNPLTFSFSNSPHDYYPTWFGPRRPNIVGDPSMRDNWRDFGGDRFNVANMNSVFDINAFAYPEAFTIGNAGRNIVSGPGLRWTQVSAQKEIPIKERLRAEIRWDMNNALKTYNFTNPSTAVDLVNPQYFGKISDESRLASMGGGPVMHLTIRLSF